MKHDPTAFVRLTGLLRAVVEDAFGSIPGVTLGEVSLREDGDRGLLLVAEGDAWGPTLHARHRTWAQHVSIAMLRAGMIHDGEDPVHVDAQLSEMDWRRVPKWRLEALAGTNVATPEQAAKAVRDCLEPVASVQRMLSRHAAALGIDAPIAVPERASRLPIAHILVDRPLADLLVRNHGVEAALARIRSIVSTAITSGPDTLEDAINLTGPLDDEPGAGVTGHMGDPTVWIDEPIDPAAARTLADGSPFRPGGASYDGAFVTLPFALPETLHAAAPGRPLGDIMETGVPSLDAARIDNLHPSEDGGTVVELGMSPIRLGDHPDLGRAACHHGPPRGT